jgi:NAD(P)-dependent dehydrogenase (short-subunit alcohol dehydrogenase family)
MPSIVITGGAHGIGLEIGNRAIADGYQVIVVDRDVDAVQQLKLERPEIIASVLDVTNERDVDRWATALVDEFGVPDALVNNAGIGRYGPLAEISVADWRAVVEVNLTGVFIMTQRLGREMVGRGSGSIVSIASVGSVSPSSGSGAYPSTKAAVVMLMQMAAVEWGPHGVRANSVSPGFIRGGLAASFYDDPVVAETRRSRVPSGVLGSETDVAAAVMYLCSQDARYINAHNLVVDGGLTATAVSSGPRFAAATDRSS